MDFLRCVFYLAINGFLFFAIGRVMPKGWLHSDRAPFKSFAFEKDGKIYEKIGIKHWQNKVPDMSRILPWAMPAKKVTGDFPERLPVMLQETCVAELIHWILCIVSAGCIRIWRGAGGVLIFLIACVILNLPFIIIQRYNRPRLLKTWRTYQRMREHTKEKGSKEQ